MAELTTEQNKAVAGWKADGWDEDEVAELAIQAGWSPVATIKALKHHYGLPIGQGKVTVDRKLDGPRRRASGYLRVQAELLALAPHATEEDFDALEAESGWSRKLWGLIECNRDEAAAEALQRFDTATVRFPPMSLEEATGIVEAIIATWDHPMVITATTEHRFGWSFGCQSAAFAQTGDMLDAVIGHGPILVDKWLGVVWRGGSGQPNMAANYEATGNPFTEPDA